MSGFDGFLGNDELKMRLIHQIRTNGMAHAYIIEGAVGSGKKTLAKLIAAAMTCHSDDRPCLKCLSCDKIMREQSRDVIYVTPESGKVKIGVDVIRNLREDASYAAGELDCKCYIFPDAGAMNVQAQNAFLKVLEEPIDGILFLLLCESAGELLPTIRSRAPVMRTEPLTDSQIIDWLTAHDENARKLRRDSEENFLSAVLMAQGSLGRAISLCSPENRSVRENRNKAERFITLLAARKTSADDLAFLEYAANMTDSKQRQELVEIYFFLGEAIRDLIAVRVTKRNFRPLFYPSAEKAATLSAEFSLSKLLSLSRLMLDAQNGLNSNMNTGLLSVDTALSAMSV